MELFPSTDETVWDLIKSEIDNSDYYLLLLGGLYGSQDPDTGLSYTEKEYDHAVSQNKPIVAFVHDNRHTLSPDKREKDGERMAKLDAFYKKVERRHIRRWNDSKELALAVFQGFTNLFRTRPAEGWTRAGGARRQEDLAIINELRSQLNDLRAELDTLRMAQPEYHGLLSISSGEGRDDAFQSLRARAKEKIVVLGVGMSKISMYAKRSLAEQATKVPIDFLMLDPDFLEADPAFATQLQDFLDIRNFASSVRSSFDFLCSFSAVSQSGARPAHPIKFRVYRTLPTMSMVLIDPDTSNAEMVIEFFLYQSGEHRPRFHLRQTGRTNSLFNRIYTEYLRLWNSARLVR